MSTCVDYFDDTTLAKQFEALRRSGLLDMVDRDQVMFWAREAGYDELELWTDEISPDVYQVEAERFIREYKNADISPYSESDVLQVLDPAQRQAWEETHT